MARPSQIEGRLRAILDPDRPRGGLDRKAAAIATAAMLLVGPLAALRVAARSVDAPPAAAQAPAAAGERMTVSGRVLDPQGKPIPDAPVMVVLEGKDAVRSLNLSWQGPKTVYEARSDGSGRFRVAARFDAQTFYESVHAQVPDDEPYLTATDSRRWEPGAAVEQTMDLALARGVVVRGKVFEEGSGRPVAGASVVFAPYSYPRSGPTNPSAPAVTGPDGLYRVVVPAGPGNLVVQSPDDDHVLRLFGADGGAFQARPGRQRSYASAYHALEIKPGETDVEVDLAVRRGATVRVVVLYRGEPVRNAWVFSRLLLPRFFFGGWREWSVLEDRGRGIGRDGRFVLHGLDPESEEEVPAYFLDPERRLGATVRFSPKSAANGPVTVSLEPCGSATARLVDSDGKPITSDGFIHVLSLVVSPGPPESPRAAKDGPRFAEEAPVFRLDPVNYKPNPEGDAQGHVAFPALIPGARYRILDRTTVRDAGGVAVRKEFVVKPGELINLGDILIAKP